MKRWHAILAVACAGAAAASFLSVFRGEGPIYFEVGCVILVIQLAAAGAAVRSPSRWRSE